MRYAKPDIESGGFSMKIILEKDIDLKSLETKVNSRLESLDEEGHGIRGITYSTDVLPRMRSKEVVGYDLVFSVMIAYAAFTGA